MREFIFRVPRPERAGFSHAWTPDASPYKPGLLLRFLLKSGECYYVSVGGKDMTSYMVARNMPGPYKYVNQRPKAMTKSPKGDYFTCCWGRFWSLDMSEGSGGLLALETLPKSSNGDSVTLGSIPGAAYNIQTGSYLEPQGMEEAPTVPAIRSGCRFGSWIHLLKTSICKQPPPHMNLCYHGLH